MASTTRTRGKAAQTATNDTPVTPPTFEVRRSEGVKRAAKEPTHNPLRDAYLASLTEGALAFDVATEEEADKAIALLQRAAQENQTGLTKSKTKNKDGSWSVDFEAKSTKRERQYTALDIREFARQNGYGEISGRIPREIRDAFRKARGLPVREDSQSNQA